jgi:cell division protein FtsN
MNRFTRFSLYMVIALVLYFAAHLTLISAFPTKEVPPVPVVDTMAQMVDTIQTDSLLEMDTTAGLITNEDIIAGGNDQGKQVEEYTSSAAPPAGNTLPAKKQNQPATIIKQSVPSKETTTTRKEAAKSAESNTVIVQKKAPAPAKETKTNVSSEKSKTVIVSQGTANDGGNEGKYMVMAGSYLVRDNAEKMVERLAAMGYKQAEILPKGNMFAVVAARYSSESKAREVAETLKRKQIDSFVKSK